METYEREGIAAKLIGAFVVVYFASIVLGSIALVIHTLIK